MQSRVAFDERVGNVLLKYARMVVARGHVHNTLGNIAVRVPHPDFPDGVVYTKPAEISLEEVGLEEVLHAPDGALVGCETVGQENDERRGDREEAKREKGRAIHEGIEGEVESGVYEAQQVASGDWPPQNKAGDHTVLRNRLAW